MKKLTRIGIPFVVLVIAGGMFLFFRGDQNAEAGDYFTAAATRGSLKRVVNATGVVQTILNVQVGSQVSGQVEELYADFNSFVKRGQLLAKLDTRNLDAQLANSQASVAAARARLRSAEAEIKTHAANLQNQRANVSAAKVTRDNTQVQYQRATELSERGVASKNDFDTAKANFESAEARYQQALASLEQVEAQAASTEAQIEQAKAGLQQVNADLDRAQINLGYANIFSPVDGVVISRSVDVGQTIAASMQAPILFTIATDLGRMQVNASVDEADIGSISEGSDVTFTVDAYPNDNFSGEIAEIRLSPQTVQNVVTYSVILAIENPGMKLKPGMTANITVTVDERADSLKVPNAALRYSPPNTQAVRGSDGRGSGEPGGRGGRGSRGARGQRETSGKAEVPAETADIPLAPGQKWDPDNKVRFVASNRTRERPGTIWVLGADRKPEPRNVVVGITDGASTEIVSGELRPEELVIVGDSSQTGSTPGNRGANPGFLLRGLGGGGGRR